MLEKDKINKLSYAEKELLVEIVVSDKYYDGGIVPRPEQADGFEFNFVKSALKRVDAKDLNPEYRPVLQSIRSKLNRWKVDCYE